MKAETQTRSPENSPLGKSEQSKPKRGGQRAGAGRKPNPVKIVLKGISRTTLLQTLENVDPQLVAAKINKPLQSKREIIWLQALILTPILSHSSKPSFWSTTHSPSHGTLHPQAIAEPWPRFRAKV